MASGFGQRRKRGPERTQKYEKTSSVYYGKEGYAAFLQAFQLILRHQAKFIENKLKVSGYEVLLRDLWRMFLEAQNIGERLPELENEESGVDHNSGNSDDDLLLDPMSDDESNPTKEENHGYMSARYSMHRPILIHSIALCYLALNMLRVPITIHDFRSWIVTSEFPYMRAIRHVPVALLSRLAPGYYQALEPQIRPRASRIWKWTQQTALFLNLHSKIEFPALNYRPLLFTMVKDLLLPLETFNFVIATLDDLPVNLYICSEGKAMMNNLPPETRVLCVLLITAKLFYNLDGISRQSQSGTEPPARTPNMKAWRRIVQLLISNLKGVDTASKTDPVDVLNMAEASVDNYLDWFTKTWISDSPVPSSRTITTPQGILDMFPVTRGSDYVSSGGLELAANPTEDKLKTVRWLYSHPHEPQSRSSLRPGQEYTVTSLEMPSKGTAFDDLIELAAVMSSTTNHELRKHVAWLENYLARKYRRDHNHHAARRKTTESRGNKAKTTDQESRTDSALNDKASDISDSEYVASAHENEDYPSSSD